MPTLCPSEQWPGVSSHSNLSCSGFPFKQSFAQHFPCRVGGPAFAIQANPSVAKIAIVRQRKASVDAEGQDHDRDMLDGGNDAMPDDAQASKSGDNRSPGSSLER